MAKIVALVPAAGVGSRFGGDIPKQYLSVAGQTVLFHTLNVLNQSTHIEKLAVVLSAEDTLFEQHQWPFFKMLRIRCGGATRAESVLNGIQALIHNQLLDEEDWVLVHDAARCCLTLSLLNRFIEETLPHPVGGLLALPVADTLKKDNGAQEVLQTVSRDQLWQAQTPQMFRAGMLRSALERADRQKITDEASAIELLGFSPLLVEGDIFNFKITYPQDIYLSEAIHSLKQKRNNQV